ncbi:MAG: hypothetical protein ACLFPF_08490 [Halanaerobiales bacterium]
MDRFTRGFFAGIMAAVIQLVVGLVLYYLEFTELLWLNFASVLIYGREPLLFAEQVFSELSVFFFSGLMGILFAYLLTYTTSNNYLLKGFVFAETVWFSTFSITLLFKIPEFRIITFKTSVSNFILSAIWGLLLAEILHRFDTLAARSK